MKKILSLLAFFAFVSASCMAEGVEVILKTDNGATNTSLVQTMERNLSMLLTEINDAQREKRDLNIVNLPVEQFAKSSLLMLWANVHFYCDDDVVVTRLWPMRDYYLAHNLPIIITPEGETFGSGSYQEAVVEFDKNGRISDFRFSSDTQGMGMSLEQGGSTVEAEREAIIYAYCDRFRTAYNTKDINFLRQIFSEDALIITGKVVMTKPGEAGIGGQKVVYNKQSKQQYLSNLQKSFARNKWIDVKFSKIGENGETGGPAGITRSENDPNFYGVRLRQEWHSANYNDVGYVFLLWDFTDEDKPVIHVRTWQPEWVGGQKMPESELISLSDFENDILKISKKDF